MRTVVAAALLVAALAVATHWSSIDVGPTGQDTVILMESSRVQDTGELGRMLGSELRRNIRPTTAFYRPLVNLSFALDGAIAGDSYRQVHRSSIAWHALASVGVFLLLLRLGFSLPWALAGAAVFALHPLSVEVVPAPARRGESMVVALTALACAAWPRASDRYRRARQVAALALAALAPLAKETAYLLPVLWVALPGPGRWRRLALGVAAVLPALLVRSLVLAGAGGYAGWSLEFHGLVDAGLDLFDDFRLSTGWGVRVLVLGLVVLAVRDFQRHRSWRPWIFGAAWLLPSLLLLTLARGIGAWYLYMPLVGAVVFALGVLRGTVESGRVRLRAIGWAAAAVLAFLALRPSPLWTDYPEWRWVGAESQRALERSRDVPLEGRSVFRVAGLPREVYARPAPRFRVRSATGVTEDTLRAWWRWHRGVDVRVDSPVDLVLHSPRTRPTRAWSADGRKLRIFAPPGTTLWCPRWATDPSLRVTAQGSCACLEPSGEELWLWTGGEYLKVRDTTALKRERSKAP